MVVDGDTSFIYLSVLLRWKVPIEALRVFRMRWEGAQFVHAASVGI